MGIFKLSTKKSTQGRSDITLKEPSGAKIDMRVSVSDDYEGYSKVDVRDVINESEFKTNYDYWKKEALALSVNNFNNVYYQTIIAKGMQNLPFIYNDLKDGETSLIHALELIFPNEIPYSGYISLKIARKLWLRTLKKHIKT